ncbi:sugar phosphate isomerase/epimerase family protein [Halorubrum sp. Boch-26]|uniref:sugar phosphate isomerase/epimerase family protein n=1 Tax=Halorubrum sp. Boch-26 TaxID=2994426 RepID=UPI0024684C8F|nr:sugar phosphate isomerase/epimerase family protein [Halorubrum sp. Boch-26]
MNPRIGFVTSVVSDLERQLRFAGAGDFDYVEVLMDGEHNHERLASQASTIRGVLDEYGLDLAVHLPFPTDIGSPYERVRAGAVETQQTCIDVATDLGAEKGVLHPESSAWTVAWEDATLRDHIDESTAALTAYGAARDFEICAENIFGSPYTVEHIPRLLDETDASMTLDTGHARVTGYDETETAAFVAEHADRISHVHLNDTRRPADEHLPFGAGNLDFEPIFDAFPSGWSGTFSLEVGTQSLDYLEESRSQLARYL